MVGTGPPMPLQVPVDKYPDPGLGGDGGTVPGRGTLSGTEPIPIDRSFYYIIQVGVSLLTSEMVTYR